MKKLAYVVGGIVVLIIVVALVAPFFVDLNNYKPQIEAQAKAATGRDLKIEGPISLSLLPLPSVSVSGVKFGNAPGPYAALTYDGMKLLASAITTAGGTDSAKVMDALQKSDFKDGLAGENQATGADADALAVVELQERSDPFGRLGLGDRRGDVEVAAVDVCGPDRSAPVQRSCERRVRASRMIGVKSRT